MLIRFVEVGRDKKTWEAEIPCHGGLLDSTAMYKSIKAHGALGSRDIEIDDDGNIWVGGFRKVGWWEFVEVSTAKAGA